ncbi:hypothetical protein [Dysgonomonas sp. HGC4]|uniref:hypothetical protein n=1 Tax=Dysgonomonas sp. HGC4 TaxID=1658009 RepID=UPI0006804B3C|nr:hypothetical protein [Dysgonomonas sp. HGC4]MBD8349346.1 hypothetical protein [Dysgonomonas sp. HGC4]
MDEVKKIIFSRYIGQFLQATEVDATIRKSSEQIVYELSEMESYTIQEVTQIMAKFSYKIGFDDTKPVWLMKLSNEKALKE